MDYCLEHVTFEIFCHMILKMWENVVKRSEFFLIALYKIIIIESFLSFLFVHNYTYCHHSLFDKRIYCG